MSKNFEYKKQISVELNDYVEFSQSHYRKILKRVRKIYFGIIIFLFTTAVYGFIYKYIQSYFVLYRIFILVIVTALMFGIVRFSIYLSGFIVPKLWRFMYQSSYNRLVTFKKADLLLNEKGIELTSINNRFSVVWTEIKQIVATANSLYFYHTPRAAVILPKRYLENQSEYNKLKDFLEDKGMTVTTQ